MAASLAALLRLQQPRSLFYGEVDAISAATAAAAVGAAASFAAPFAVSEGKRCDSLQQQQQQQQHLSGEQRHGQGVLLLLRRFAGAVSAAAGGQSKDLLQVEGDRQGFEQRAAPAAVTAAAVADPAAVDRAISALFSRMLHVSCFAFLLHS